MTPSRKYLTVQLLSKIQACPDPKKKQELAWEVVQINDAAATWLARRFQTYALAMPAH